MGKASHGLQKPNVAGCPLRVRSPASLPRQGPNAGTRPRATSARRKKDQPPAREAGLSATRDNADSGRFVLFLPAPSDEADAEQSRRHHDPGRGLGDGDPTIVHSIVLDEVAGRGVVVPGSRAGLTRKLETLDLAGLRLDSTRLAGLEPATFGLEGHTLATVSASLRLFVGFSALGRQPAPACDGLRCTNLAQNGRGPADRRRRERSTLGIV